MDKPFTIGGSEVAALLGFNKWLTPIGLYCRKMGLTDPPVENEMMRWGIAAEHVVARRYAKETGATLTPSVDEGFDRHSPFIHPIYPWYSGTPDRFIGDDGILEIKVVGERTAREWTESAVPISYLIQCQWYLELCDRLWADLAVQIGNRDYRVYRIDRDREMAAMLIETSQDFINTHLIPQIPPPLDSSESSAQYLKLIHPQDDGEIIPASGDVIYAIEQLRNVKQELAKWEDQAALYENIIKGAIGDKKGLAGDFGKVIWSKNKVSEVIDTKALRATMPHIAKQFTIRRPGARVFRTYFKEL